MSPVCKMADSGRLTVDQKVKVVLFYADTKSVVATQRCFRAHFVTRWAPCKQTIYILSLGIIFQPMRINSVPDVKCFFNNKNVLCVNQWHDISCATLYLVLRITRYLIRYAHYHFDVNLKNEWSWLSSKYAFIVCSETVRILCR